MRASFEIALPEDRKAEAEAEASAHIERMIYLKFVLETRLKRTEDGELPIKSRSDMSYAYEDGVHKFWVEFEFEESL
jgi:hypothetical protein